MKFILLLLFLTNSRLFATPPIDNGKEIEFPAEKIHFNFLAATNIKFTKVRLGLMFTNSPCNTIVCTQEGYFSDVVLSKKRQDYGIGKISVMGIRSIKLINHKLMPIISLSPKLILSHEEDNFSLGPDLEVGVLIFRAGLSARKKIDNSISDFKKGWLPDYRFEVWLGF